MSGADESRVTQLVSACAAGDARAVDELLPLLYRELRRMAQVQMSRERSGHTFSATALVHEAYLKLIGRDPTGWACRSEFFGAASTAMRRILVDHARARKAQKRGGSAERIPLDDEVTWFEQREIDLVDLDRALAQLAEFDAQKARLVEFRFFGGFDMDQTAEMLSLSKRTAEREWTLAKAWLRNAVEGL